MIWRNSRRSVQHCRSRNLVLVQVEYGKDGPIADGVPPVGHTRVAEAVGLARALGRMPPRLRVYGIEGEDFAVQARPTPAVARAIDRVAAPILRELEPDSAKGGENRHTGRLDGGEHL